jgi:two-component system cell cycle response regulator
MAGRILIVDNVPTNRILLKVKLSGAFYEVLQATSGAEAIKQASHDQPDIIILDISLGDMSAQTACAKLKSDPSTRHIPVLIATPQGDSEAKISALKAGADEFLSKPIDELTLIARVRALMRARATADELRRRDTTARILGIENTPTHCDKPGKIALIGRNAEDAMTWRAGLRGLIEHKIEILPAARVLEFIATGDTADIYLISCDIHTSTDGLRLISDIRARPKTRRAGIILVHGPKDRKEAIMALDLGANDIITRGADPEEMALRLRSQLRRKQEADALRASVERGLQMAMIDPLTGLYNRRYAIPHLSQIAEQSAKSEQSFALMALDLDHFKSINDTYGHDAGDKVLIEVASRLRDNMRGMDLIARVGGEEFLICMPATSLMQAREAAERIREVIVQTPIPIDAKGGRLTASISIGLAMGGGVKMSGAPSIEGLLKTADQALYNAKSEGRNQVTLGSYAA